MTESAVTPLDARELLQFIELTGIQVFEVSGRVSEAEATPESKSGEVSPELGIRIGEDDITVRMKLELVSGGATYVADMAVVYTVDRPVNVLGSVAGEFVERVGAMAIFPYVREAIFTTATRMGRDAPVLGIMRAGDFDIGDLEGPDFVGSPMPVTVSALAREMKVTTKELLALMGEADLKASSGRSMVPGPFAAAMRAAAYKISQGEGSAPSAEAV